ncbi:hypothetical protein N7470_002422 [Penicillium chermesinum]|nr:hypothetical protein N7470_002422 [Penicillium chermesinum]
MLIVLLDRNSKEVMPYIDIKSKELCDILQEVLYDVKAISLMEDKLSGLISNGNTDVDLDRAKRPFSLPPELYRCAESTDNSSGYRSAASEHLCLLINYLKQAYTAISQCLS